jgi:hypothetical protein
MILTIENGFAERKVEVNKSTVRLFARLIGHIAVFIDIFARKLSVPIGAVVQLFYPMMLGMNNCNVGLRKACNPTYAAWL